MSCSGAVVGRDRSRAGWKILIPGVPQWSWHQRARAIVLFGSYLVALGVGLFAWGTPVGALVLAFAFGTHVASATDVIRQRAFPGLGRWVPMLSASGGLGLGIYGPALAAATLVAWPGLGEGPAREGYLVNCRAYRQHAPQPGDWVWLRSSPWGVGAGQLGRVVAGPGQEVEWSGDRFRIGGRLPPPGLSWRPNSSPVDLAFTVPDGHALIVPGTTGTARSAPDNPLLVPRAQILGRAWARLYPIRDRQFLD